MDQNQTPEESRNAPASAEFARSRAGLPVLLLTPEMRRNFEFLQTPEEQTLFIRAIFAYALDGREMELKGAPLAFFLSAKDQIDKNRERYFQIREMRKRAGEKGRAKFRENKERLQALAEKDAKERALKAERQKRYLENPEKMALKIQNQKERRARKRAELTPEELSAKKEAKRKADRERIREKRARAKAEQEANK